MNWLLLLAASYTAYFSNGCYYYNRHQTLITKFFIILLAQILPAFLWFGAGYFSGVSHGF